MPQCTIEEIIKSHIRYLLANGMEAIKRSDTKSGTKES